MFEAATSILSVIDYIARRYYIYPPNNFLPDGSVKGKRNQNFPLKVSDIYFCYVESVTYITCHIQNLPMQSLTVLTRF